jgi:hypothetical protein
VNWYRFESSLFCLGAISSTEDESLDRILEPIFGPALVARIASSGVPHRAVRTVVNMMAQSTGFFKRHPQYLATSLNFLFATLQTSPSPDDSARAIAALCSQCRRNLTSEITTFLHKYAEFIYRPGLTDFAAEKLASAIGYLLQALPKLGDTISGANIVLEHVSQGLSRTVTLALAGDVVNAAAVGSISVHCLAALAESLRRPADEATDLYEGNPAVPSEAELAALKAFQATVFKTVAKVLEILRDNGEILGEICTVFKAGLTESKYALFHFAPDIVVEFFCITHAKTANLEAVLRMACTFLRSKARQGDMAEMDASVGKLLLHLAGLFAEIRDPREDSDVSSNLIEVLKAFIPTFLPVLLKLQPVSQIETILEFTLKALEVPEPLPKRAAMQFWVRPQILAVVAYILGRAHGSHRRRGGGRPGAPRRSHRAVRTRLLHGVCAADRRRRDAGRPRLLRRAGAEAAAPERAREEVDRGRAQPRGAAGQDQPRDAAAVHPPAWPVSITMINDPTDCSRVRNQRGAREVLTVFWSECHGLTSSYAPIR